MLGQTYIPKEELDSEESIAKYNNTMVLLQKAGEELEANNTEVKEYSFAEKTDAGWLTSFWGYAPVKEYLGLDAETRALPVTAGGLAGLIVGTFMNEVTRKKPVDEDFVFDEKAERLKQEDIPAEEWQQFMDSTNRNDFEKRIDRHHNMEDAKKTIASLPLTEALAFSLVPSMADPATGSIFLASGKLLKSAEVAMKFTGASKTIYKAIEGAAMAGGSVALSEYLIQSQNYAEDDERIEEAALFGAALGFAIPVVPSIFTGVGSIGSQALASKGVQNTLKASGIKDFVQKHLTLNPMDKILTSSTAPQVMKDWVKKADTLLFAERDINGNIVASPSEVAMGYRDNMMGKIQTFIKNQIEQSKATGKTIAEIDEMQHVLMNKYVNEGRQLAEESIISLSVPERVALYQQATGTTLKVNKAGKYKLPQDFYNVLETHFIKEHKSSGIIKQAPAEIASVSKFFKEFEEEGTLLNQPGVAGKEGSVYMPRAFDRDLLLSDRAEGIRKITESLAASKLNKHLMDTGELTLKELKETAIGIYEKALETDMRHRYLGEGLKQGTTPTRLRALRMDTTLYPELFSKSMQRTALEYGDNMAGKLAANKFFGLTGGKSGNHGAELRDVLSNFAKQGASVDDVKNMEAIIESIYGTRKFQMNPHAIDQIAVRLAKKSAGALYSAGFSRYSLAELGAVIAKNGVVDTIKSFIPAHKQMLKLINGTGKDDPILTMFTDMHLAGQYLGMTRHDRFDTLALQHNVGTVERSLDNLNHWGRKVSFFAHLQDTLDFMAGGAYFNEVFRLSKNINKINVAQESRMARYGLSKDDIVAIGKENIIYHKDGKTVADYNLANWKDQELAKKFHFGLQHAVKDTIVRTDGTRISRHLSDNKSIFKQLMFQYMQFPSAAFERLVLNMEEHEARTAVGIMSSMVIMYGMNDLADAAMVQLGVKDKRASVEDLALKSALSTPFAGLSGTIYDTLGGALGLTTTGGYTPRPGQMPAGAAIGAVGKIGKYTAMGLNDLFEGEFKEAFTDISHIAPILNALTFVNVGFKAVTGQETKERPFIGDPISGANDTKDPLLLEILNNGDDNE